MNSTVSSAHPTAQQLYANAGTDFSNLTWLEAQWVAWYLWIGNPIIATGLASFLLHEVRVHPICSPNMFANPNSFDRLSTLAVASHGSSSTRRRTSGSGSFSPRRSLPLRSNGSAPSRSSSRTSWSSSRLYVSLHFFDPITHIHARTTRADLALPPYG